MGFDLLNRLPTADESQFSSKQLSSSIDGAGRCPLPLISKHVLFHHFDNAYGKITEDVLSSVDGVDCFYRENLVNEMNLTK